MGWGAEEPRPGVSNSQLPELAQASPGGLRAGVAGEGPAPTRPGTSALGLEVLSLLVDDDEDSPINNMLVRCMHVCVPVCACVCLFDVEPAALSTACWCLVCVHVCA